MSLWDRPVRDVRPLATEERRRLVTFLSSLAADEWAAPSAAPGWTVKDLALHLLDGDLGWLSRERDGDLTGLVDRSDRDAFGRLIAAKNQRWLNGARGLSRRAVTDLLLWSGEQVARYDASRDLRSEGWVMWASDGPVPFWFNLAQEFTERWVHQQQMREAVNRVEDHEAHLAEVLRTFVWALPHQFHAPATAGTQMQVDLGGDSWHLTSDGDGTWSLAEGAAEDPAATAAFSADSAWRWLTGTAIPEGGFHRDGPPELLEPLLRSRAVIV